jgi:hypothetical protein
MKKEDAIELDDFISYLKKEVNPKRKISGLSEIGIYEARECFMILKNFHKEWKDE